MLKNPLNPTTPPCLKSAPAPCPKPALSPAVSSYVSSPGTTPRAHFRASKKSKEYVSLGYRIPDGVDLRLGSRYSDSGSGSGSDSVGVSVSDSDSDSDSDSGCGSSSGPAANPVMAFLASWDGAPHAIRKKPLVSLSSCLA